MSKANEPAFPVNYKYDCPHCYGEGVIEHIGEGITEDCEHCAGTGRESKKTDAELIGKSIILTQLQNSIKQRNE